MENDAAMSELADRLKVLDGLHGRELHEELVTSVLAGNMFDWGAQESAKLMEKGTFGFAEAVAQIQRTYSTPKMGYL